MESLNLFFSPSTGTTEEWNAAFSRVDDFFRAHRVRQTFLILDVLKSAAIKHAQNPTVSPTTLAVREAQERVDRWLQKIMAGTDITESRQVPNGLVAFLLNDGPRQFPEAFLHPQPPRVLVDGMRQRILEAGPDLQVSNMVPRPIDLGLLPEMADQTWEFLEDRPYLRVGLIWLLFVLILGLVVATIP